MLWPALALLAALLPAAPSPAHELRPLIATVEQHPDALAIELSMNLEAAIAQIGPQHNDTRDSPKAAEYDRLRGLSAAEIEERLAVFAPTLLGGVLLEVDGRPAELAVTGVEVPEDVDPALPRLSTVALASPVPGATSLTWQLAPWLGDSVIRLRAAESGEIDVATFVRAGESTGPLPLDVADPPGTAQVFATYLELGFVHIVPRGLDHILFVVGLFLLSSRLSALLWQISAFTVAHTATLVLGATGTFTLPASIVEPLIAASIVWIGVENLLTDRLHRWRPVVVFAFGLLHGLGFAGVLGEFGLPTGQFVVGLLAFNIGVELGQLAVVALCFVAVGWAMGRRDYRAAVVMPASLAISCIAAWWMVERVGLV